MKHYLIINEFSLSHGISKDIPEGAKIFDSEKEFNIALKKAEKQIHKNILKFNEDE